MIKGILIDLDNTLYDYDTAHHISMLEVVNFASNFFSKDSFISNFKKARMYINNSLKGTASSHNRILYFQKTIEYLDYKDIMIAKKFYDLYWNTFLLNMQLYDGVIDFFKSLSGKKICILTDLTAYIQYKKIEKLGITEYISELVTSEEAGIEKPDKKMFDIALYKLNLNSDEVVMIGDSYEKDITGALNSCIKPYWKTNKTVNIEGIITFNNFIEITGKI